MGTLPIYSREHLKTWLERFFRKPSPYDKTARPKKLIGTPVANYAQAGSYFIVRITYRKAVPVLATQKSIPGDRKHVYYRNYYAADRHTYAVYLIRWESDLPELIEELQDKAAALAALRALR